MKAVVKFLQENITGVLATVADGKPKVRPFQFMLEDGGKLYFCTNNAKEVYKQLKARPLCGVLQFYAGFCLDSSER